MYYTIVDNKIIIDLNAFGEETEKGDVVHECRLCGSNGIKPSKVKTPSDALLFNEKLRRTIFKQLDLQDKFVCRHCITALFTGNPMEFYRQHVMTDTSWIDKISEVLDIDNKLQEFEYIQRNSEVVKYNLGYEYSKDDFIEVRVKKGKKDCLLSDIYNKLNIITRGKIEAIKVRDKIDDNEILDDEQAFIELCWESDVLQLKNLVEEAKEVIEKKRLAVKLSIRKYLYRHMVKNNNTEEFAVFLMARFLINKTNKG